MSAIDVSEVLKAKFVGKSIKHSVGAALYDGQVQQKCPCPPSNCCDILYEFGYGELTFDQLAVTYGSPQRSSLPAEIVRRRWILENYTDVPDKKTLNLQLVFNETIAASVSKTVTEGRTTVFSASAQFDFKVYGKYSLGYTETISLSVQNATSRTETRTKTQTETYDFGYEIPPRTAAIIDLSASVEF